MPINATLQRAVLVYIQKEEQHLLHAHGCSAASFYRMARTVAYDRPVRDRHCSGLRYGTLAAAAQSLALAHLQLALSVLNWWWLVV